MSSLLSPTPITHPQLTHACSLEDCVGPCGRAMVITHTYSPPAARGRGLAAQLTGEAMSVARRRGWCVRPTCPYVRDTYLPAGKGEAARWVYDPDTDLATLAPPTAA